MTESELLTPNFELKIQFWNIQSIELQSEISLNIFSVANIEFPKHSLQTMVLERANKK